MFLSRVFIIAFASLFLFATLTSAWEDDKDKDHHPKDWDKDKCKDWDKEKNKCKDWDDKGKDWGKDKCKDWDKEKNKCKDWDDKGKDWGKDWGKKDWDDKGKDWDKDKGKDDKKPDVCFPKCTDKKWDWVCISFALWPLSDLLTLYSDVQFQGPKPVRDRSVATVNMP